MVRQKRNKNKAKFGKVNIEIHSGSYRLRFTDPSGNRKAISVCPVNTEDSFKKVEFVAKQIDSDMAKHKLGVPDTYDPTLGKYRPGYVPTERRVTLWDYWEDYKERSCDRVSNSRQQSWKLVDNVFLNISKKRRGDISHFKMVAEKIYSGESLRMIATNLNAALAEQNNYQKIKFDISKKIAKNRSKEAWSQEEIKEILNAFYTGISSHHYYPYVAFLAYTGCRPEEAIPLTWSDVHWDEGYILIEKVHTHGELRQGTKTGKVRKIPINSQLHALLTKECSLRNKLLFPAKKGGYLDQKRFNQRHFNQIVKGLFQSNLISKAMPTYNLRNSWITLMLKKGLDLATVAKLAGTSEKMILKHYWGADDSIAIPEI